MEGGKGVKKEKKKRRKGRKKKEREKGAQTCILGSECSA